MEQIGRYRVLHELGRGAMGIVYKAQDPTIGRLVAIKTIRLSEFSHPDEREQLRSRLFREAQSAGILSHPGIVTIYDIAEEKDLAYIAMEFVDGETLEKVLETESARDPEFLISVVSQAATALEYAHNKGIIHRDIKPGNIMVNREGVVKITDFGIARITSSKFTNTGTVMGTPSYMSPEQVRGAPVDGRSDMFSLTVVLYEMLTGQKPFTGDSITTIIFKIVSESPAPAQALNPSVGSKLNEVVMKALAKEPSDRYQNCREFAEALQAAAAQTANLTPTVRKVAPMFGATEASDPALLTQPDRPMESPTALPPRIPAREDFRSTPIPGRAAPKLPPLGAPTLAQPTLPTVQVAAAPAPLPPPSVTVEPPKRRAGIAAAAVALLAVAGGAIYWAMQPGGGEVQEAATPPAAVAPAAVDPPSSPPEQESRPPAEAPAAPKKAEPPAPVAAAPVTPPAPVSAEPLEIRVTTDVPGARVVLDGDDATACTTPCVIPARTGRRVVLITRAGHYPERREVQVERQPVDLSVTMRPITGTLMLSTVPPGATITVNGANRGESPLALRLPAGKYTVTAAKEGFSQSERIVEVEGDAILQVRMTLGGGQ